MINWPISGSALNGPPASRQAQIEGGDAGWTKTFTDPRLCAAIVDRLTFDAHIIATGTDSYRLRTAKTRHQAGKT